MLARDGYTEQQVRDALHGRSGAREIKFRYDVVRGGAVTRSVAAEGQVALDTANPIQRTAKFTLYAELDWLKDQIKPVLLLRMEDDESGGAVFIMPWDTFEALSLSWDAWDALGVTWDDIDNGYYTTGERTERWIDFPLGVFIPSTPTRNSEGSATSWDVEAYDRTVILREDCLTGNQFFAAGTPYLSAVSTLLQSAGISNFLGDSSSAELPADREFEFGESKLDIINTLLSEIGFNPIFCDADGNFVLEQYIEPTAAEPDYSYAADDLSVIARDTSSEMDTYNIPNVFVAVCSNPDLDEDYRSVWVNGNPASRLSTMQRGRSIVSEIYMPDAIASQEALDTYIERIGREATLRGYEVVTFSTALMPIHGSGDILNITHPDVAGTFAETSWSMELSADAEMTHTARRVMML